MCRRPRGSYYCICQPCGKPSSQDGLRRCKSGCIGTARALRAPSDWSLLALDDLGTVHLEPDCLTGLKSSATLQLRECGLASISPALTSLGGSLQTWLQLPFNNDLQIADDDVTIRLALRKLRKVDLRKMSVNDSVVGSTSTALRAQLRYDPAAWSFRSLRHLVELSRCLFCAAWPCGGPARVRGWGLLRVRSGI